jgi:hypothetical protein
MQPTQMEEYQMKAASEKEQPALSREEQIAIEKYKLLFELWMSENPIKTTKLQTLMATNSILASVFFLVGQPFCFWIAWVCLFFSKVWVLSNGRAVSFQHHWRSQMEDLRKEHSQNAVLQIHSVEIKPPIWGRVPSKYYLLGTPIATAITWLAVIVYLLLV